jgi:hypothetical protein
MKNGFHNYPNFKLLQNYIQNTVTSKLWNNMIYFFIESY